MIGSTKFSYLPKCVYAMVKCLYSICVYRYVAIRGNKLTSTRSCGEFKQLLINCIYANHIYTIYNT